MPPRRSMFPHPDQMSPASDANGASLDGSLPAGQLAASEISGCRVLPRGNYAPTHDRSSDRCHRPQPDRARRQGVARRPAPRRHGGPDREGPDGQGAAGVRRRRRRSDDGVRAARRRGRFQHRPCGRGARRPRRRPGCHGQPLLLVEPADDPHGRPCDQGRRGRLLHRRRRRSRQPLRQRRVRHRTQPDLQGAGRAHGGALPRAARQRGRRRRVCPTSTSRWARRPRTSCRRKESPARRWTSSRRSASSAPSPTSRTASGSTRSPRSPCPTARVVSKDDGPRAGTTVEGLASSSRCSDPTARSPPATPARSTTAPPP